MVNLVMEVRELAAGMDISFVKISHSANGVADYFAKLGVDSHFSGTFFLMTFFVVFIDFHFLFLFSWFSWSNPFRPFPLFLYFFYFLMNFSL